MSRGRSAVVVGRCDNRASLDAPRSGERVEAGQEARTGSEPGDRIAGRVSIETLKASRQDHTQALAAEVTSGEDVKASSRYPERSPRELKT